MWSRLVAVAVVVLIAAAGAWALWPRPVAVEVATIVRGPLTVTVEEEGLTRIREIFRVSAPVGGTLTRMTMHVGDAVGVGDVIASIGPAAPALLDDRAKRVAQATLEAAEAAVELASSNLSQAEAEHAFAAAELLRTEALAEKGIVSTQTEERSILQAQKAAEGVTAAKAALLMRQQERESARAALGEGADADAAVTCCTLVKAPAAGRVLEVLTESELVVQAGTPLVDIGDTSDLEVVVEVLSSDAVQLTEGAAATVEDWGGEPLDAVVRQIDPVATTKISALGVEEQRTRVVLDLLDPAAVRPRLGHGFRVVARIVLWRGDDLVTVPMSALFRRGDAWAAFVVQSEKAVLREVGLGRRNDDHAEVLEGLSAGDTVIVHPSDTIEDGTAVAAPQAGGSMPSSEAI